ncbi:lysosomal-associated transmembrane protein 4A-like [Glandiceps talaboti]
MGVVTQRRQNDPTCCLFCHVRTGTILIGLFFLTMQVFVMVCLGYLIVYGGIIEKQLIETDVIYEEKHTTSDLSVAFIITFCMFLVTCMLLCGAMKHRAGYLLPFFCLQLFDFVLSCLTAINWFTAYPDGDGMNFPYNQEWYNKMKEQFGTQDYSNQWMVLISIITFLLVMTIKAYIITVVWACYKYIINRDSQQFNQSEDTEALLGPPAYNTVIKVPPNMPTPPPYQP